MARNDAAARLARLETIHRRYRRETGKELREGREKIAYFELANTGLVARSRQQRKEIDALTMAARRLAQEKRDQAEKIRELEHRLDRWNRAALGLIEAAQVAPRIANTAIISGHRTPEEQKELERKWREGGHSTSEHLPPFSTSAHLPPF